MSSHQEQPVPAQEELFEATSQAHTSNSDGLRNVPTKTSYTTEITLPGESKPEEAPTTEASEPETAIAQTVDVRRRAAFLINSLDLLAQVSKSGGFRKAVRSPRYRPGLEAKHGEDLDPLDTEVAFKKPGLLQDAGKEFKKAYETGMGPTSVEDPKLKKAWDDFSAEFSGPANHKALAKRRDILKKYVALEGDRPLGDSYEVAPKLTTEETLGLSPREKLITLYDTEKFLAHSKDELTEGVVLTGVVDAPLGVFRHIEEKAIRNRKLLWERREKLKAQKELTEEETAELKTLTKYHIDQVGLNTAKSAALEYFDYYDNARQNLGALRKLWATVAVAANARVTVPEAIEDEGKDPADFDRALAAVVQFVDLNRLRKFDTPMTYDPLVPVEEDRDNQVHPEKNKTITDAYTAKQRPQAIIARLEQFVGTQKLHDVLPIIKKAMANEGNRMAFWDRVLGQTKGPAHRVITQLKEVS